MDLNAKHLAKQIRVGTKGGKPVFHLETTGGLSIFAVKKGDAKGDFETLSVGPHVAVARFIAKRDHRDLVLDQIAKSEEVPVRAMAHQIPVAERLTARMRELEGKR